MCARSMRFQRKGRKPQSRSLEWRGQERVGFPHFLFRNHIFTRVAFSRSFRYLLLEALSLLTCPMSSVLICCRCHVLGLPQPRTHGLVDHHSIQASSPVRKAQVIGCLAFCRELNCPHGMRNSSALPLGDCSFVWQRQACRPSNSDPEPAIMCVQGFVCRQHVFKAT